MLPYRALYSIYVSLSTQKPEDHSRLCLPYCLHPIVYKVLLILHPNYFSSLLHLFYVSGSLLRLSSSSAFFWCRLLRVFSTYLLISPFFCSFSTWLAKWSKAKIWPLSFLCINTLFILIISSPRPLAQLVRPCDPLTFTYLLPLQTQAFSCSHSNYFHTHYANSPLCA